jgi:hypothetical protein
MSWYGYGGPAGNTHRWHGGYYPSYFEYSNWSSYGGAYRRGRDYNWGDWGAGSRLTAPWRRQGWAYDRVLDGYLARY